MLLKVDGLDVAYGSAKAVHEVSLELRSGEMVFLVGRNGAGKTTLLKTIAGFIKPAAGSIFFDNQDIGNLAPERIALKGIRYIFQDKRVFTKLTVKENLEIAAYPTKSKLSDAISKLLSIYPKMEKFLDAKAGGLSGGQRQILLIGRALIANPRLLLIDEPTEGLAAEVINDIFQLLTKMKGSTTMMIVEQNIPIVKKLANRVYVMKEGRLFKELNEREAIQSNDELEKYL